ncbi:hypothetical protein [Ignavigranum ruoffiae]|uniref:hypothetical protein n=1 Tax=Ignavigranum ruoffiae TaxID=89093 RepID=UPI002356017E|nr:hypothetical protein [Ignavigranum ruoffiae]
MRYDTPITFESQASSQYDYDLGEWVEGQPQKEIILANVTDLGTKQSVVIFGDIKENALVVRLPFVLNKSYQTITINDKPYKTIKELTLRHKRTLILQEVSR